MTFEYIIGRLDQLKKEAEEIHDPKLKDQKIMDLKSELDQTISELIGKNLLKEITIHDSPWG